MNRTPSATTPRIGVAWTDPAQQAGASQLARTLGLPLAEATEQFDCILHLTPLHLELSCPGHPSLRGSVRVDFVRGSAGYRRRQGGGEVLIRALGHKKNRRTVILDATGGWGEDALVMAVHGCEIHLVERNPVVSALLRDGIRRASEHPDTRDIASRLHLIAGDSLRVMERFARQGRLVDAIYLDPMFPDRTKAAKVKKKSQVLQLLAGRDNDADRLLAPALQSARNRVVVKRPRSAPFLAGTPPSHSYRGRTIRFDVYLIDVSKQGLPADTTPAGPRGRRENDAVS